MNILALSGNEFKEATKIVRKHSVKPSNALHVVAMKNSNITTVVSEDRELDKINEIKRIWI